MVTDRPRRRALDLLPTALLLAEHLDDVVDVFVTSATGRSTLKSLSLLDLDLGKHLEGSDVLQIAARTHVARLDRRCPGGAQLAPVHRLLEERLITSPSTSWRTPAPKRWRMTFSGTLPGRNPGRRTFFTACLQARIDLAVDGLGGHANGQPSALGAWTLFRWLPALLPSRRVRCRRDAVNAAQAGAVGLTLRMLVRKERLELSRHKALEPKSSASTSSATSAFGLSHPPGELAPQRTRKTRRLLICVNIGLSGPIGCGSRRAIVPQAPAHSNSVLSPSGRRDRNGIRRPGTRTVHALGAFLKERLELSRRKAASTGT
jgi:hypothetical protein